MIRQKGQMSSGFHAMGTCRSLCAAIMKEVMVEVEVNQEVRSGVGVGTSSLFRARSALMLRVRRRLWTPAHIRHLPTAYRFLKPPSPAFSTRDDASKSVEHAPIELPPPRRSDDLASSAPSLEESTHAQLASSSSSEPSSLASSPQTESLPHEHTPPPVQEPMPEPKDRSIKVGPSTTEELAKRLRLWSHLTKARMQERSNQWTTTALGRVSQLGGQLNQITGYEEIDALKRNVAAQGTLLLRKLSFRNLTRTQRSAFSLLVPLLARLRPYTQRLSPSVLNHNARLTTYCLANPHGATTTSVDSLA
jgi:hypothetical protein